MPRPSIVYTVAFLLCTGAAVGATLLVADQAFDSPTARSITQALVVGGLLGLLNSFFVCSFAVLLRKPLQFCGIVVGASVLSAACCRF